MSLTLIGFILYLLIILYVGFITYKNNKNHHDYFLAGRKLNPWVVAFSERASGESAWLLLGLPGLAYASGLIGFWDAFGCVGGIVFYWFFIAHKLRVESQNSDSITLPDFFAKKFNQHQNTIRVTALLIIIFFFTFYLASQFNAAGKVLNVTFGIDWIWGVILGAVVIVFYTMMGGFFAVAWTDLVQGIIMIGALIILPVVGWIELQESGISFNESLQNTPNYTGEWLGGLKGWGAAALVISGLSWGFGYMGQPHLLTRFMSIKDPEKIKFSRKIALTWAFLAFMGAMFIGLLSLAYYGPGGFEDREFVMPQLTKDLLPGWLAGIFISGAVAAMMSTADSQLLVITSSVIEDFYHKTLGKEVSEKRLLQLSRLVTIGVGILGFIIAIKSEKLVFKMVSYAWSGLGASFGPALLLLLWWKKITSQGVIAGMISGALMTIIWSELPDLDNFISVRFVSFAVAFILVILVSLFTYKKK
jgi:sodium/proline symporter